MKRELITSKQMAPHFTGSSWGPGVTTLCTSGLAAPKRGVGHLNTTLYVCICLLTCKQKANL